jgi:hypothetical protein
LIGGVAAGVKGFGSAGVSGAGVNGVEGAVETDTDCRRRDWRRGCEPVRVGVGVEEVVVGTVVDCEGAPAREAEIGLRAITVLKGEAFA